MRDYEPIEPKKFWRFLKHDFFLFWLGAAVVSFIWINVILWIWAP